MENNTQILGNENSVIYYNLNKQFSNIKKVIITKEIILNSFENSRVPELLEKLKGSNSQTYDSIVEENLSALDSNLIGDFYKEIQENLNKISDSYMDVKLKDYNFMNSVSNTKFNLTLRTESFSITNYYIEKGAMLSNIKGLIREYLKLKANKLRIPRIDNFQIEIYETEEMYKQVFLKKDSDTLILSANYGFQKNIPFNYNLGSEFYISRGENFKFFKNKQNFAIIREHNRLVEKEIEIKENILTNEDLVLINKKTKHIEDALIECYITNKGNFKIINVSLIENHFTNYSDNGFVINKSTNNYDRVSILTIRDNFDDESVNPRYLLLKNDSEIKEFITNLENIDKIDGIILTQNFYSPLLDKLGVDKNLDIIYFDKQLQKSLDEKINWETLDIENSARQNIDNPFAGIISEQTKEKDIFLEKLKNIDLNTSSQRSQSKEQEKISSLMNNITGSDESSFNQGNRGGGNNNMFSGSSYNSNGEKKSAMGMLADTIINNNLSNTNPPQREERVVEQGVVQQQPYVEEQKDLNSYSSQEQSQNNESFGFGNMFDEPVKQEVYREEVQQQPQVPDYHREEIDVSVYEGILATEIIGTPNLSNVNSYFVDMNTISQVDRGTIYYLTLVKEEMRNPNLNYILPIRLNDENIKDCSLLITNPTDFFLIDENQKNVEYFVNIFEINDAIKEKFLSDIIKKVGPISLICSKDDLKYVETNIKNIKRVKVKNIEYEEDLEEIRNKILGFEKRVLMKKFG
ncbi:MAG: hypothetical protein PF569_00950 [Candidatus Woesearchaeota archaeon]|jgi:hypothetical protein|nr:hypothetical protein [Candidatus Woesearchaeota archaeon]